MQRSKIKIVGVGAEHTAAQIASGSAHPTGFVSNSLLPSKGVGCNRAQIGGPSLYSPTAHTIRITGNAVSHTNDQVNRWIRSLGFVFKIKTEQRTTSRRLTPSPRLHLAVPPPRR